MVICKTLFLYLSHGFPNFSERAVPHLFDVADGRVKPLSEHFIGHFFTVFERHSFLSLRGKKVKFFKSGFLQRRFFYEFLLDLRQNIRAVFIKIWLKTKRLKDN